MMKKSGARLGILELAGMGFATGVLGGTVASFMGEQFDTIVPSAAALGVVAVPVLWLGIGVRLTRVIRRPRRARAVTPARGLIA